jgi:putative Holliday junction resolvase
MTAHTRHGQRTLLGFDYGKRRIGVAVGQEITATASPVETVPAKEGKPDWAAITRLIQEWRADALVVGLPLNMDDTEQEMTRAARRFANQLKGRYHLPVYMADERLTSYAAEHMLDEPLPNGKLRSRRQPRQRDEQIDHLAAQLILTTFFNQQAHDDLEK